VENVSKPFPLTSNKTLEASTTIKQCSVEDEQHSMNISQHQVCKTSIRDLSNG